MREDRGRARLQRPLVGAEARVTPDSIEALLRICHQVRRERAELTTQPLDGPHHRRLDVRLVVVLVRVEPLAIVVALQRPEERERLLCKGRLVGHGFLSWSLWHDTAMHPSRATY